jgi:hypothetical protein
MKFQCLTFIFSLFEEFQANRIFVPVRSFRSSTSSNRSLNIIRIYISKNSKHICTSNFIRTPRNTSSFTHARSTEKPTSSGSILITLQIYILHESQISFLYDSIASVPNPNVMNKFQSGPSLTISMTHLRTLIRCEDRRMIFYYSWTVPPPSYFGFNIKAKENTPCHIHGGRIIFIPLSNITVLDLLLTLKHWPRSQGMSWNYFQRYTFSVPIMISRSSRYRYNCCTNSQAVSFHKCLRISKNLIDFVLARSTGLGPTSCLSILTRGER